MSDAAPDSLAERKAQLVAQIALERMRMSLAVHEIRTLVAPPRIAAGVPTARPIAAVLAAIALPMFGMPRVGRWVRMASYVMTAIRIARNWKRGP